MEKTKLVVLLGGSGSGKTTTEDYLKEHGEFVSLVSMATRERRAHERDGVHYHFVSPQEFDDTPKANSVVLTPEWKYGISIKELKNKIGQNIVYSVINVKPAVELVQHVSATKLPFDPLIIFFDIPAEKRIPHMKARGETEENIRIRIDREDKIEDLIVTGELPAFIVRQFYPSMQKSIKSFIDHYDEYMNTEPPNLREKNTTHGR